jgi:hypothetical protein
MKAPVQAPWKLAQPVSRRPVLQRARHRASVTEAWVGQGDGAAAALIATELDRPTR